MNKLDAASLILRVGFGLSMMAHGWNKVFSPSGVRGTAGWFESIGMRWPRLQARIAAGTELIAGLLLTVGLLTGLASMAFISLMIVAIATVHWKVGYFIFLPNGGWEYCAAIAVAATALSILGPGSFSLDNLFGIDSTIGTFAFPVGVLVAVCHLAICYRPTSQMSSQ